MSLRSKDKVAQRDQSVLPDAAYRGLFCEMCGEPWSVEIAQELRMRADAGERDWANTATPAAFLEEAGDGVRDGLAEWARCALRGMWRGLQGVWLAMVPSEPVHDRRQSEGRMHEG